MAKKLLRGTTIDAVWLCCYHYAYQISRHHDVVNEVHWEVDKYMMCAGKAHKEVSWSGEPVVVHAGIL